MINAVTEWLVRNSRKTVRSRPRKRRRPLGAEILEGRVVLSTFTVNSLLDANPPAGSTTLRQAIVAANADHDTNAQAPDMIDITVSGTIVLASALPAITGSVEIEGPGSASLTIEGDGGGDAILSFGSAASATVSGVTLNGKNQPNTGITVAHGANVTVQSDVIEGCESTTDGGAILNDGGTLTVSQSTFFDNLALDYGGGVASLGGTLTVSQSTFQQNFAESYDGGGLFAEADTSGDGGVLTVLSSTFFDNLASHAGGGIALGPGADATVVDSTLTDNIGEIDGGGIALFGITAVEPQISLRLSGSTVTANEVGFGGYGGGIYVIPKTFAQPVLLNDSIIAGNSTGGPPPSGAYNDVSGAVNPSSAFNLIGVSTSMTGLVASTNGNMIGSAADPINPDLGPVQNNGGPTLTIAPLPNSPAIDHGGPDPVGDDYTSMDQTGNPRIVAQCYSVPAVGGDGRDIGAVELPAQTPTILTVNSTADSSPPAGALTLREAIEAAEGTISLSSLPANEVRDGSPYVDEIEFTITGTIALTSSLPTIEPGVAVDLSGPGAALLTIQGDGLSDSIFNVAQGGSFAVTSLTLTSPPPVPEQSVRNDGISAAIDSFVGIQDAVLNKFDADNEGGAIMNQSGFVTLSDSEIENNFSVNLGGAIATFGGSVGISQCVFTSNSTLGDGGAIDAGGSQGGGSGAPAALTIVGSTFVDNTAIGTNGGGGLFLQSGTVTSITSSTFVGNTASNGGAIYESGIETLTIDDTTLTGNLASVADGGIDCQLNDKSETLLQDTIVAGNFLVGSSEIPSDFGGTITSMSADNLFGDGNGVSIVNGMTTVPLVNGYNGNLVGTAAQPLNPKLGPLETNGGPTPTEALLPGSPAIGAGQNPLNGDYLLTDQRGYVPATGSPWDIGAYQSTATPAIVTALAATNVTVANFGQTTYSFSVVVTDTVAQGLLNASALTADVVTVIPPFGDAPITATRAASPVANGPTDPEGDAHSYTLSYSIVPPHGMWTSADNGSYSVDFNGAPIVNLANAPIDNGMPATFQVETASIAITKYGLTRNVRTGIWSGTVNLTNSGTSSFSGPLFILFDLPPGVVLKNATGAIDGTQYIELQLASLAAGATTSLTVEFNQNVNAASYTTQYYLESLPS
jgi:hypothetical protein